MAENRTCNCCARGRHRETGLSPPVKYFYWPFHGGTSFVVHLCCLCLVFLMLLRLFIAALWSPAGKAWPLGSCWWCLLYFCYFPMRYPGSGGVHVLDCIVSWSLPPLLLCYLNNNGVIHPETLCADAKWPSFLFCSKRVFKYRKNATSSFCGFARATQVWLPVNHNAGGEFNDANALGRSLYWCQAIKIGTRTTSARECSHCWIRLSITSGNWVRCSKRITRFCELGSCQSNVYTSWGYEWLQKSKDLVKACFENVNI